MFLVRPSPSPQILYCPAALAAAQKEQTSDAFDNGFHGLDKLDVIFRFETRLHIQGYRCSQVSKALPAGTPFSALSAGWKRFVNTHTETLIIVLPLTSF